MEKKLPQLPDNTPPKLREIIEKQCWIFDTAKRATALSIVEGNPWAAIYTEATTEGAKFATEIWNTAVKKSDDGDVKSMSWEKFAPVFLGEVTFR
jgi:hypothetical protein